MLIEELAEYQEDNKQNSFQKQAHFSDDMAQTGSICAYIPNNI